MATSSDDVIAQMVCFRANMNADLSKDKIEEIWGEQALKKFVDKYGNTKQIIDKEIRTVDSELKVKLAKNLLNELLLFDWVKFIAVSGSAGAGIAKLEDDIDLFIVVKNDMSWIYRLITFARLRIKGVLRSVRDGNVANKFCLNFICEERGLAFENEDIFVLHEIFFMEPIFGESYLEVIKNVNGWIYSKFGVLKGAGIVNKSKRGDFFFKTVNLLFLLAQVFYMTLLFHKPNYNEIYSEFKKGRISFFPHDFRKEKLDMLSKNLPL